MAVSVINPIDGRVVDANGNPIVGARRYVYNAQTTTERACYTDPALTIAADNPQISIADGTFPRVYTAAGTYKIRQETAAGLLIGAEVDDIDSGLSAGAVALPIVNGGTGATTAAAARANLDVPSNSELAAVSATIATFTAALANIASFPQGRLTLTSNTPVLASSVSAATTVFYTPYTGQLCPVYDGVQFNLQTFAELSLVLNINHVLNSIYDVYVINDSSDGVVLATSPAWSNISAGSCSRAGTADLARLQGLLVNAAQLTMRNGGTTYTVAANRGTYVGSIFMDGTAGQVSCLMSYGQSRKWGVWNAYNRAPIILQVGDNTATWTYIGTSVRASNNTSANSLTLFSGLAEEFYTSDFFQNVSANTAGSSSQIGIGFNSTTAFTAFAANSFMPNGATSGKQTASAKYVAPPSIGINVLTCLENFPVAAGQGNFNGGSDDMLLTAQWRA